MLRLDIPITKVDAARRLVYGVATAEVADRAGEICDYASTKPFYETWSAAIAASSGGKSFGNLRAMHGSVAAGKVTALTFNDDARQIEICAKVVDDAEWDKVVEGVYTGFSQGGAYVRRWTDEAGALRYTADPHEISLVDMPCLAKAGFELVKADGSHEWRRFRALAEPPVAGPPVPEPPVPDLPVAEPVAAEPATATSAFAKAGARNSAADQARVQAMHDTAVELGAACLAHKAVAIGAPDLAKQFDALADRLVKAVADVAARVSAIEEQPQPLPFAGTARIVGKAEDAGSNDDPRLERMLEDPDALALLAIKLAQRQRR